MEMVWKWKYIRWQLNEQMFILIAINWNIANDIQIDFL